MKFKRLYANSGRLNDEVSATDTDQECAILDDSDAEPDVEPSDMVFVSIKIW